MNWTEIGKHGLVIIVVAVGVWLWRDSYWKNEIANAPAVRDTVTVRDTLTLTVESPARTIIDRRIDSVLIVLDSGRDSLIRELSQIASIDTMAGETRIHVTYVPLDKQFSLRVIEYPKHTIITDTKLVYAEPHWLQYAALVASGAVTAYGVIKEDWLVAGIGAGVGITVGITL